MYNQFHTTMSIINTSTSIAFLLGLAVGYFIRNKKEILPKIAKITKPKIKVLHKSEPKTFEEKRSEALDKDKPIIKTFRK